MGIFGKSRVEKKLSQMENSLTESFANVKSHTENLSQWVHHLHQKNLHQERLIAELHSQIRYIPKTREDFKKIIDSHYSFEEVHKRIENLHQKIEEMNYQHKAIPFEMQQLKAQIMHLLRVHQLHENMHHTEKEEPLDRQKLIAEIEAKLDQKIQEIGQKITKIEEKKPSLKERIVKQIVRNSKDYLKGMIISYIKKYGNISAYQLKQMVVEEQKLCSKSSFYRFLIELESDPDIGVVEKGKEKHYIYKLSKAH